MEFPQSIRLTRRQLGYSQSQLAERVGVRRSAVSQWESARGKAPTLPHLQAIALAAGVNFEWLATGRGEMLMAREAALDAIAAVMGLLVDDPLEVRLLQAFRHTPVRARVPLIEVTEALARSSTRHRRGSPEQ